MVRLQRNLDPLERRLGPDQVASWIQRLADTLFDPDRNNAVCAQARAALAEIYTQQKTNKIEPDGPTSDQRILLIVQNWVLQSVRLADHPAGKQVAIFGSPEKDFLPDDELGDRILTKYPAPIAHAYRALIENTAAGRGGWNQWIHVWETLVEYLATVTISAYRHAGMSNGRLNQMLAVVLLKSRFSMGELLRILSDIIKNVGDCGGHLPYAQLTEYLYHDGEPTHSLALLEAMVTISRYQRMRIFADSQFGTASDEDEADSDVAPKQMRWMNYEMAKMDWLSSWILIQPQEPIQETTRELNRWRPLMGAMPRNVRLDRIVIDPMDVNSETGLIHDEESLLLLYPDRSKYLPLFPLHHFLAAPVQRESTTTPRAKDGGGAERKTANAPAPPAKSYAETTSQNRPGRAETPVETARNPAAIPTPIAAEPVLEEEVTNPNSTLIEVRNEQLDHRKRFVGREQEIKEIQTWVDQNSEGRYLLVIGPPGQGKSALAAELAWRENEPSRGCAFLHHMKNHANPRDFMLALISQISKRANLQFGPEIYKESISRLRELFLRTLEVIRNGIGKGKALILLDAVDAIPVVAGRDRLEFLPRHLPRGIRIILTCRPDLPLIESLRARLRDHLEEWRLPRLSQEEFHDILEKRLESDAIERLDAAISLNALHRQLEGNPLFLHLITDALERILRRSSPAGAVALIKPILITQTLEHWFREAVRPYRPNQSDEVRQPSPHGRHILDILHVLAIARDALSIKDISDLCTLARRPQSVMEIHDRLDEISIYLQHVDGERYRIWHKGFAEYLRKVALENPGVSEWEARFSLWLSQTGWTNYALRYRIDHLASIERDDNIIDLLTDWRYLEAKTEAGLVFELARDFARVREVISENHPKRALLELIKEAIRRDPYFLKRRPKALFQCFWNLCWWYDCEETKSHYLPDERQLRFWEHLGPKLSAWMEAWRASKEKQEPGFLWLRSMRPPNVHLGTAMRAILAGHESTVSCVAVSPDGNRVAASSHDKTIRVWDIMTSRVLLVIRDHEKTVFHVSYSPNGRYLVSASEDKTIRIWDARTGEAIRTFHGHEKFATCARYSPNGNRILSSSYDHTARVWDVATGELALTLRGHEKSVLHAAYSFDGKRILTCSDDKTARIWDAATGKPILTLSGHAEFVTCSDFSPDGRTAVTSSRDQTLKIWDVATGLCLRTLQGHRDNVNCVAFSPDGRKIVSGSHDLTVRIWDAETGRSLIRMVGHDGPVESVRFTIDGKRVITGSEDTTVRIWDPSITQPLITLRGSEWPVTGVAISPRNDRIVTGSRDNKAQVWDIRSGQNILSLRGHEKSIECVAYSPDGTKIATGSEDMTVRIWETETGRMLSALRGHRRGVTCVSFSPHGGRILSGSEDKSARIWDPYRKRLLVTLRGHDKSVLCASFSPDGRTVVTGSQDKSIRLWNAETGGSRFVLQGHGWSVNSATFAPNGTRIVSGSSDRTVRVWDAKTGLQIHKLTGHEGSIVATAFSPNSHLIASASKDLTIRIWDSESGALIHTLRGHEKIVSGVTFSCDGQKLISCSFDMTTRIWDLANGELLQIFEEPGWSITSLTYSPDGTQIAAGCSDAAAHVWDAETGLPLLTLQGHEAPIESVAYSPDGLRIVTRSDDLYVRVWDAATGHSLLNLRGHGWFISGLAYSPDGSLIAAGLYDKTVCIWNIHTNDPPLRLIGHEGPVEDVKFSPDGTRIISSSYDSTVRFWDPRTGELKLTLHESEWPITSVAFSPNGQRIVTGSWDQTARVWDTISGKPIFTLVGHEGSVKSVSYSPDGTRIVTGSTDTTVRTWNAETGEQLLSLRGGEWPVTSAAYSPDGQRIVSGSWDQTARVWEAETGRQLLTLQGHEGSVKSVAYSPDGQRILTGSSDTTARVWDAQTGLLLLTASGHEKFITTVAYSPDGRTFLTGSDDKTLMLRDAITGNVIKTISCEMINISYDGYAQNGRRLLSESSAIAPQTRDADPNFAQEGSQADSPDALPPPLVTTSPHLIADNDNPPGPPLRHPQEWFTPALQNPTPNPNGRGWIGSASEYLVILKLEGDPHRSHDDESADIENDPDDPSRD